MEILSSENCNNNISADQYGIRGLQKMQLKILKEFDRVCRKDGLKYFLAYGTCLGAVRHHGFIPWDMT